MTLSQKLPHVEIIVLNWNGKDDTVECLRSLDKIDYPNKQISVVDNASTDDSVELIKGEFPDVSIIENETNLMYAGGNNAGIRKALDKNAEYILILNNDTAVQKDFLIYLMRTALSERGAGIVCPKICYYENVGMIWYAGGFVNFFSGNIYHRGLRKLDTKGFDVTDEVDYATGCCMLITRAVFDEIGLLDEKYYIYTEDVDFSFRARKAGFKVVFEPRSIIWHKVSSATGGGITPFKIYHKIRSNFRFIKRYAKWYHWLTFPAVIFIRSVLFTLSRLVKLEFREIRAVGKGFFDSLSKDGGVMNDAK